MGAVVIHQGRVLLARRGTPPRLGQWSLPGGMVESGETLREAVEREALEETGLVVEVVEILEVLDRITQDAQGRVQYHYVLVDFLCRHRQGEALSGGDVSDLAWASQETLADYALEQIALEVIRKAFHRSSALAGGTSASNQS